MEDICHQSWVDSAGVGNICFASLVYIHLTNFALEPLPCESIQEGATVVAPGELHVVVCFESERNQNKAFIYMLLFYLWGTFILNLAPKFPSEDSWTPGHWVIIISWQRLWTTHTQTWHWYPCFPSPLQQKYRFLRSAISFDFRLIPNEISTMRTKSRLFQINGHKLMAIDLVNSAT